MKNKETIIPNVLHQHLILYCKGHYNIPDDFITGLKRIWAIRCGYDYEHTSSDISRYIANDLLKVIIQCKEIETQHLGELVHEQLCNNLIFSQYQDLKPIDQIIMVYRNIIAQLQVKDDKHVIIQLCKPKKQVFNSILRGKGKYEDYDNISKL